MKRIAVKNNQKNTLKQINGVTLLLKHTALIHAACSSQLGISPPGGRKQSDLLSTHFWGWSQFGPQSNSVSSTDSRPQSFTRQGAWGFSRDLALQIFTVIIIIIITSVRSRKAIRILTAANNSLFEVYFNRRSYCNINMSTSSKVQTVFFPLKGTEDLEIKFPFAESPQLSRDRTLSFKLSRSKCSFAYCAYCQNFAFQVHSSKG